MSESKPLPQELLKSQFPFDTLERIQSWLNDPLIDASDRDEVVHLIREGSWGSLNDAFFQDLEFGTGGLRGVVGNGSNRMNKYIIQKVTQGLSNFVNQNFPPEKRKAAIAYDSRLYSRTFAETAASILAANGIQVHIFPDYETTPCLSFAVRYLNCATGLCLTASHNPPEYAGYKVYSETGAQIVPPVDQQILSCVAEIQDLSMVKSMNYDEARNRGLIADISSQIQEAYDQAVQKLETCAGTPKDLKVVYTPLHGTGALPAKRIMKKWGFKDFSIVPDQEKPDGHFPTVSKPNPEEPQALQRLVSFAKEQLADVGFATDPDSDRLALVSKEDQTMLEIFQEQRVEDYVLLNGNQTGALLLDFILSQWKEQKRLPPGATVIKTIVTSEMHHSICQKYGVGVANTLTGFKWIAALVHEWEKKGMPLHYVFGTEESFGYMPGTYVRDKDGIAALAMAAEMCDAFKKESSSACQKLCQLFREHGAWYESLHTIEMKGSQGKENIGKIMRRFRDVDHIPLEIAGKELLQVEDYLQDQIFRRTEKGLSLVSEKLNLPPSDVIILRLSGGCQISLRPSGTEPKIKFYFSAHEPVKRTDSTAQAYASAQALTGKFLSFVQDFCGAN